MSEPMSKTADCEASPPRGGFQAAGMAGQQPEQSGWKAKAPCAGWPDSARNIVLTCRSPATGAAE